MRRPHRKTNKEVSAVEVREGNNKGNAGIKNDAHSKMMLPQKAIPVLGNGLTYIGHFLSPICYNEIASNSSLSYLHVPLTDA